MVERSHGPSPPWPIIIGAVILAAGLLLYLLYLAGMQLSAAPRSVSIDLSPPPIPDAPRLPSAPTPKPQ